MNRISTSLSRAIILTDALSDFNKLYNSLKESGGVDEILEGFKLELYFTVGEFVKSASFPGNFVGLLERMFDYQVELCNSCSPVLSREQMVLLSHPRNGNAGRRVTDSGGLGG